jgi:hypothetical protein
MIIDPFSRIERTEGITKKRKAQRGYLELK